MRRVLLMSVLAASVVVAVHGQNAPAAGRLDAAMEAFWNADGPASRARAGQRVLASGAGFASIFERLKAGRPYGRQPAGRIEMPSSVRGLPLDNVVKIPKEYDPGRRWPVRVSLHGGVGREAPRRGEAPRPLTDRIPGSPAIVIHPRAWAGVEWWTADQVDNILSLVDKVKRAYNVDESRVYVTGISDGGTGVYFFGMREATLWSACMPLNGHPSVLANPDTGADGELFAGNLANCPLSIVNGGKDPLYPAASVQPLVDMFTRGGIPLTFHVYPDAGHNVSWWPEERARFEQFLVDHPRAADPARVTWETERVDRYNRFRWISIDRLGEASSDSELPDINQFEPNRFLRRPLYDRSKPSGRVDALREGNAFGVKTRGVREFRLLLSPDVVDFARPVRVTVNGIAVHDAVVQPNAAVLIAWAAKDNDRTMLYGAELRIEVP